jgi:hypothetical protein
MVGGLEYIFPYIGNVIIPTDSYFSEGLKPPTRICGNIMEIHGNFMEYIGFKL